MMLGFDISLRTSNLEALHINRYRYDTPFLACLEGNDNVNVVNRFSFAQRLLKDERVSLYFIMNGAFYRSYYFFAYGI
jgi:hypothetical protein